MSIYSEIKKDVEFINAEFDVLILAPGTKPFFAKAYSFDLRNLLHKIMVLNKRSREIINELDSFFIEDVGKFDRAFKQWNLLLDKGFEKILYNFSGGSLKDEVTSNPQIFWLEYMKVRAKIYDHSEIMVGVNISEMGLYYGYILNDIKQGLIGKYKELKGTQLPAGIKEALPNRIESQPRQQEEDQPNDFLLSTIEDYLSPFKKNMSDSDYKLLIEANKLFFETEKFPKLPRVILVFGKLNKKKLGWALNELFRKRKPGIPLSIEYLKFGLKYISCFADPSFDENNYLKSKLYSYYTTKA